MRRKVLLVAILILSMVLQCMMPFVAVYAETEAEEQSTRAAIALNSELYKAVKAQLKEQGIAAEYKDANGIIIFEAGEIEKVKVLNLSNSEIDDLGNVSETYPGLDAFTNLEQINLHANYLTKDSHLEMLDSFPNLKKADLSSNEIESVNSIANFHSGTTTYDITDQRVTGRVVINVDDSEDAENRTTKKAIVALPQILLEAEGGFSPNWIWNSNVRLTREIIPYSYTDPDTGLIVTGRPPEIDYENSFQVITDFEGDVLDYTDGVEGAYPYMIIKVAEGEGDSYTALRGLIKFKIEVLDSTSVLANTQMTFYYAITGEGETGIAFNDGNFYRAVRDQLTKGQERLNNGQGLNNDTTVVEVTRNRNVYAAAYDEAMILVIEEDDIINNIPSLVLNDKMIYDLTGLEEFVGLKSNLNISYNYIKSIEKVVALENNKAEKEQKIRAKYQKYLDKLKTVVTAYDQAVTTYKEAEKAYQDAVEAHTKAVAEWNAAEDNQKEAKLAAIQAALDAKNKATQDMQDALDAQSRNKAKAYEYEAKLYKVYEKEYKMISLLPSDINYMGVSVLSSGTKEYLGELSTRVMSRISDLEKVGGLTDFEEAAIVDLITDLGNTIGVTYKTQNAVEKVDPTNPENTITEYEPIEYPIATFFETVKGTSETLSRSDYATFLYFMKSLDALSQIEQYSKTKRLFERTAPTDDTYVVEALRDINELYDEMGYDLYFYNLIAKNAAGTAYEIDDNYYGFSFTISLPASEYSGTVADGYKLVLAHKQAQISNEDVNTYIYLPRLKRLNMADNKTRSLEGIETLSDLIELNAWKNMVNDISNVDWTAFTNLQILNLGYNQISDIKPLQDILTLISLNVSYNLLEGKFDFRLINMRKLMVADFSHNQYTDIQYANDQFILRAMGYDRDGDGRADGLTVPEWLEETGMVLSFQYQTTTMETTIVKTDEEFIEFELPLIFRQLEQMDNARTSFGVDSIGGLVEPEGTAVKLRVPEIGTHKAVVSVEGRNGYTNNTNYGNGYTTEGIGYGTTCTIKYTVVEGSSIPVPVTPVNPENPENPTDPTNPEDPTNPTTPEYGYPVADEFVYVYYPETTVNDFVARLVDSEKYEVSVTENKTNKIGTGAVATVTSKDGETVYSMLEVVVKGDLNGDGEVDGLESGIIRSVINDTTALTPGSSFASAADVNSDGDIDSQDAMLILKYRADRITSFED